MSERLLRFGSIENAWYEIFDVDSSGTCRKSCGQFGGPFGATSPDKLDRVFLFKLTRRAVGRDFPCVSQMD